MHRPRILAIAVGVAWLASASCGSGGGSSAPGAPEPGFSWALPEGFPAPVVPDDNPMSTAKVELGRRLFYDTRMSANGTQACASCHRPARAFTDGRVTSVGSTGELHPRNAMSLTNVAYNSVQTWANPALVTLTDQALVPLLAERPVELGWSGHEAEILDRFREDPEYAARFRDAFPGEPDPIDELNVARAVSAFQRTLISGGSAYDRATYRGERNALSASARRGLELFNSERLECFHCHGGFNFSQSVNHEGVAFTQVEFHNNGLYNLNGSGFYPAGNRGLWDITFEPGDMGRFRAPTLRNIELTAPYMHDGSIATLDAVVDHYARGGRLIEDGPDAGDGARSPFKSPLVVGFEISDAERRDLIAFLKSLTDWDMLCDEGFADPFGRFPRHERCAEEAG